MAKVKAAKIYAFAYAVAVKGGQFSNELGKLNNALLVNTDWRIVGSAASTDHIDFSLEGPQVWK